MASTASLAWVESPLQLLCAIEYAESTGLAVRVLPRAGAVQLQSTISAVRQLGLPRGVSIAEPRALPLEALVGSAERHLIVGDALSGVARSAVALRMPHRLTIVDDGSATLGIPAVLAGAGYLGRPTDPSAVGVISEIATRRVRELDARGALEIFSCYELDHAAFMPNRFRWLRSRGLRSTAAQRVVLGSAAVVDGLMSQEDYLAWVSRQGAASYFPHRRETAAVLERVAAMPGMVLENRGLPIELVLAGARQTAIATLPTSAVRTLRIILAGSGSTIDVHERSDAVAA